MYLLSRSEEMVLLSIWALQDGAYGVTIREQLLKMSGYKWSLGAIYAPLHRLEKKGFVSTLKGEPISERGGRSRIYYQVSEEGTRALLEIKRVHDSIWQNIPSLKFKKS